MTESRLIALGVRVMGAYYLISSVAWFQMVQPSAYAARPWQGLLRLSVPAVTMVIAAWAMWWADRIGRGLAERQTEQDDEERQVADGWSSWAFAVAGVVLLARTLLNGASGLLMAWHGRLTSLGEGGLEGQRVWWPTLILLVQLVLCVGLMVGPKRLARLLRPMAGGADVAETDTAREGEE